MFLYEWKLCIAMETDEKMVLAKELEIFLSHDKQTCQKSSVNPLQVLGLSSMLLNRRHIWHYQHEEQMGWQRPELFSTVRTVDLWMDSAETQLTPDSDPLAHGQKSVLMDCLDLQGDRMLTVVFDLGLEHL